METARCARIVDDVLHTIARCREIALKDPKLGKELKSLQDLQYATDKSLVHKQPALTAALIARRLRAAQDYESAESRGAVDRELKEIRQVGGVGKTGFAVLQGWGGRSSAGRNMGSGVIAPTVFPPSSPYGNPGFGGAGGALVTAPPAGFYNPPVVGHYTPAFAGGWGGGGGKGRGGGRGFRAGQGHTSAPGGHNSKPMCGNCSRRGLPADHPHHSCPHVTCFKCNNKGHIRTHCPISPP